MGLTQTLVANETDEDLVVFYTRIDEENVQQSATIEANGGRGFSAPVSGKCMIKVYREGTLPDDAYALASAETEVRSFFIIRKDKTGDFIISTGAAYLGKMPWKWQEYFRSKGC